MERDIMNFINIEVLVPIRSNISGVLIYITNFSKQFACMHLILTTNLR